DQAQHGIHRVAHADHRGGGDAGHDREEPESDVYPIHLVTSAEGGVGGAALGDLGFQPITDGQQLRLGDDVLATVLEVVFEDVGFHDRIHRAAFLAETAEDALEQVDVVARG